jgi:Skp family chaperone for outer membrane proteins
MAAIERAQMRCNFLLTVCLSVFVLLTVAADTALPDDKLPIALVNVDRILKSHKPLLVKLDPLKAEGKELEAALQVRQAEIETVAGQFRRAQPGSPEQQRLQGQLGKLQADLQQFVVSERQQLQKKEVTVYLAFFRRLDAEVNKYAKEHGLKLVLRQYDTSFDDGQSVPDVMKALNRTILFEQDLDITDEILKALESADSGTGLR